MLALLFAWLQGSLAPNPQVFNGRLRQLDVAIPRIEAEVVVDGVLDEAVWGRAALLTGFSDYQPLDNRPASDSTEVLVWYSPTAIYFGVRAFESHGPVHATLADRDRIDGDDNVQLLLDTFNDRRHAFVFGANALGVQADGNRSEGGGGGSPGSFPGQTDLSADFVYQSKGHITDRGYEIEIRIPFKSLPYQSAAVQDWGLNIVRRVQHSGYQQTWTPALRASASFLSQSGWLRGLAGMQRGLVLDMNPEVTSKTSGAVTPDGRRYASTAGVGGNVRWGVTQNLTLAGTVNPDFSQVEADVTEIASDVRFALFVPEKRPFFLEGIEQFDTPNRLIYTRQIAQPAGALKLAGKVGQTNVAVLSALDDPGTSIGGLQRPVSNLLRLRRDLGQQSTLGLVYTDRLEAGAENHVAGADARIVFGTLYYAQVQGAASLTRRGGASVAGPLWEAVLDRTGRSFGFHYVLTGIDPDFVTASGFVPRTGIVHPSISNRFSVYGRQGGIFEKWDARINMEGTWLYRRFFAAERPLETRMSADQSVTLRGGWSVGLTPAVSTFDFDPASYASYAVERVRGATVDTVPFTISARRTATGVSASISTPQFQTFAASASGLVGRDVNFFETASAGLQRLTLTVDWRPTTRLRVNGRYAHERFTRANDGGVFSVTDIPRLKVEYQLARPVFLRFVGQYDARDRDAFRDPATGGRVLIRDASGQYAATTRQTSNRLRVDWLFSYQPNPGTVLFAGYGGSLTEPEAFAFRRLERRDDGVFVKLSYLFRL